jgi:hypothetical protein
MCDSKCVDRLTDEDHCGQCGNACGLQADCVDGQCSCVAGYSDCSGQCVSLNDDEANCGTCGNACGAAEVCANGTCLGCESMGLTNCGGVCVNTTNDEANCGDCDVTCRADQVCSNSACACFGSKTECTGECADLQTDGSHCGECGNACTGGDLCKDGDCVGGGCGTGQIACGGGCIYPLTDNGYCGASDPCDTNPGAVCDTANGFTCQDGTCACFVGEQCPPGTGPCTNTQTDEANCGGCGDACRADQYCNAGNCDCTFGLSDCGGACVDTNTSHAHCGGCDSACRADQVCTAGDCDCPPGKKECVVGTCTDTQTDHENCGACGNPCGAAEFCVAGNCVGECNPPNTLCGTDCINMQTSNDHCGACDNACVTADGFVCQTGSCQCTGSLTDCSGACVDTQTDSNNCGTCGDTCTGGQYCSIGACTCAGGLEFCGGNCVDTDSDEQNCGACSATCDGDETCMGGNCVPSSIDHIELTCPQSAMPENASIQCTAMAHYVGGSPPPIDVTADGGTTWSIDECDAAEGCINGAIIDNVTAGVVTTHSGLGLGQLGDMASVAAVYDGRTSNPWTITLINDYLCGVKIVPVEHAIEDFGQDQNFALPYLARGDYGITWQLIPVGIYRNNVQCTQGGPYLRELTSGGSWNVAPSGHLTINPSWDNRADAEVVYKAVYPTGPYTVTVNYSRIAMDGDMAVVDDLEVTVVDLTDDNWSLLAQPAALSIPDGMDAGFNLTMIFGGNSLDITNLGSHWVGVYTVEDLALLDLVTLLGYNPNPALAGMYGIRADFGPGTTIVEVALADTQAPSNIATVGIPVDVIGSVPVECVIYLNGDEADSQIYPTSYPAVQYEVYAAMSDGETRNITEEDWGGGWMMDYAGASGALGHVDAYSAATPGLYHIPANAPMNPNPENGNIVYQYGPGAGDSCSVEVRVRERYLCSVDVSTIPDLARGEVQTTRRLWYPRAHVAEDEALLTNINGVTQQFFVYGEYGYIQGMHCARVPVLAEAPLINGYRVPIALGDIDDWEYDDGGQHNNPIFGATGIAPTTGIGTVAADASELNRLAMIVVHVGLAPNDCHPVDGCTDSIRVNACGIPFGTPDLFCANSFSEVDAPNITDPITTYAGDITKRYYAVQQFEAPAAGCTFVSADEDFWMDESSESYTTFASQSAMIATVDSMGALNARSSGNTFIDCNWNGGASEDNLQFNVVGPLVESFVFTPIGTPTNPLAVTYAPGTPVIGLKAQFFATATLTNGDVVDLETWVAANQSHPLRGMSDPPELQWFWTGECEEFAGPDERGIIQAIGGEGVCAMVAVCFNCGPDVNGDTLLDLIVSGISVFDMPTSGPDDMLVSYVESVEAAIDCSRFFIQTPLATCYDAPAADFTGYAIAAGRASTMNLYACVGYDNGVYRAVERFADDGGVAWTKFGTGVTLDGADSGVIEMHGGDGTVHAQLTGICAGTDQIAITGGGANYLQSISLETLWNWNNCGTTADVCLHQNQTVQFVVTGDFGAGAMDLTTHSGVSGVPGLAGELPGFTNAFAGTVTATVAGEEASVDVEVYTEDPAVLNVTVSDSSLDFSDYMGGSVSRINGTVTLTGVTGVIFDVTNDLEIIPSDVTYFGAGMGVGASYNGNWSLIPTGAGSASGLSLDAEFWYTGADFVGDDVTSISVMP